MSESRECRAGGWRLHQLGELPSECGACEAYARGRESFRREVAEALRVTALDPTRIYKVGLVVPPGRLLLELRDEIIAGTFPKPPPSSGGEGGGT